MRALPIILAASAAWRDQPSVGIDGIGGGRILARAWAYVIWRCWQDRVPYDPAKHRALQEVVLAKAA
ncbi:MAG TPA: hypothetical protein VFC12_03030 [Terriglobales bacterium]|nr:hypothetical protein [Terriglobales bacterium]